MGSPFISRAYVSLSSCRAQISSARVASDSASALGSGSAAGWQAAANNAMATSAGNQDNRRGRVLRM